MHYKFVGINDPPKRELTLAMQYGNVTLDEIEGVQTLSIIGRGNIKKSLNKISNFSSEEDFLISSKFEPIKLQIKILIKAGNDYAMRNIVDKVSYVLSKSEQKLKFSDDDYFYIGSVTKISFIETQNNVIASVDFESMSPYKFKDVEIRGNVFDYQTDVPTVPLEINCTALEAADSFILKNPRTYQKLVIKKAIQTGDKITIKPNEYFGVTVNGQNAMPWLTPNSEFEKLEFSFKDVIETKPICNIITKARLRKLG